MRIITCVGDRTKSSAYFIIVFVSLTKITQSHGTITVYECFQQCYISSCTLSPLRFALFLNNASRLKL